MKIILAIDSFKGCLTSRQANDAAAAAVSACLPGAVAVSLPVSDGGEGFVDALKDTGGTLVTVRVRDPLMRPVTAQYLLDGSTAYIEVAQACGMALLAGDELNPLRTTTYGVGQMVADAVCRGARHLVVGLGGTATVDGGVGMLRALVDVFARGGAWDDIEVMRQVRVTLATDVTIPLTGAHGAVATFAPQKGATPDMLPRLEERLAKWAEMSSRHFGRDRSSVPGAGAAGGLGYAFLQYFDAACRPGVDLVLDAVGFDRHVAGAHLIVTGEGSADGQTLMGKLPVGILRRSAGVPVALIAGRVSDRERLSRAGFHRVLCIHPHGTPHDEAMRPDVACRHIARTVTALLRER